LKLTVLALAVAAIAPGAAMAGVVAPTVATSYTNTPIGVGESSGITITVSEPASGATVSDVGFVDSLPLGVLLDNPVGETATNCGNFTDAQPTPGTLAVTANSGANTITVSGATVSASSTKPCILTFSVYGNSINSVATGPGPEDTDSYSAFTYGATPTAGGTATPAALDVLPAPTATVTVPVNNAVYKYGQVVKANFACAQADYNATDWNTEFSGQTDGIQTDGCFGTDDLFSNVDDGQAIDTSVPGQHSLDVSALSFDGDITDTTVNWTVLPNNVFTLGKIGPLSGTKIPFVAKLPGAGKLSLTLWHGKTEIATRSVTVSTAGTAKYALVLTKAGKALVAKKGHPKLKLVASFKPKGGTTYVVTKYGISLH
jgi:hypothetical protein